MGTSSTQTIGTISAESGAIVTRLSGTVLDTPKAAYKENVNAPAPVADHNAHPSLADGTGFCSSVRDVLQFAGWKHFGDQDTYATGFLNAPLGWGYTGFLSLACIVQGIAFEFYNPTVSDPPSGDFDGYPIQPVPVKPGEDAEVKLCEYITGNTFFNAFVVDTFTIHLIYKLPGFVGNAQIIAGSGSTSIGSGWSSGGGECWTSLQPPSNKSQITLWISTAPAYYDGAAPPHLGPLGNQVGRAYFQVSMGQLGDNLVANLAAGHWFIQATSYGFYFRCADPSLSDIYGGNSRFWGQLLAIPNIPGLLGLKDAPSSPVSLNHAAFFLHRSVGGTEARLFGGPCRVWTESFTDIGDDGLGWSIFAYHNYNSHNYAINDPTGADIIQPALIMLTSGGEQRICGYVPGAFVMSKSVPMLSQVMKDDVVYITLLSQSYPTGPLTAFYIMRGVSVGAGNTDAISSPFGQPLWPNLIHHWYYQYGFILIYPLQGVMNTAQNEVSILTPIYMTLYFNIGTKSNPFIVSKDFQVWPDGTWVGAVVYLPLGPFVDTSSDPTGVLVAALLGLQNGYNYASENGLYTITGVDTESHTITVSPLKSQDSAWISTVLTGYTLSGTSFAFLVGFPVGWLPNITPPTSLGG